jgi:hypothetical protein
MWLERGGSLLRHQPWAACTKCCTFRLQARDCVQPVDADGCRCYKVGVEEVAVQRGVLWVDGDEATLSLGCRLLGLEGYAGSSI